MTGEKHGRLVRRRCVWRKERRAAFGGGKAAFVCVFPRAAESALFDMRSSSRRRERTGRPPEKQRESGRQIQTNENEMVDLGDAVERL